MTDRLTIKRPDDWHIHLRDGDVLKHTVEHVSQHFGRAIIMPNLVPPVLNAAQALEYKQRILAECPEGRQFEPLMVLYLTDKTTPEMIQAAKAAGVVAGKIYPAGATTNSDAGVTNIRHVYPALEAMQRVGMRCLLHGEVTDSKIDIFDREKVYLERTLANLVRDFPELPIVLEHITTAEAVAFIDEAPQHLAATITAHHLLYERNHMLAGGIRPHFYCLPILKRRLHQEALLRAATSGKAQYFLGTDSAPHMRNRKEASCGCAGSYTSPLALSLYAEAFDQAGALDKLEAFASEFGPAFYGLAPNNSHITLVRKPWVAPSKYAFGEDVVIPVCAEQTLQWQVEENS